LVVKSEKRSLYGICADREAQAHVVREGEVGIAGGRARRDEGFCDIRQQGGTCTNVQDRPEFFVPGEETG